MSGKLSTYLLIVIALCVASLAHAQEESKYAGAFLEIPVGGKALGMGGAFVAMANDESAFHWNPAGVALSEHKLAGFMYSSEYGAPGSALANFYHLGFTYPLENLTISANWVRLSIGDLLHTPDITNISVTDERQRRVREIYGGSPDYFSDNEDAFVVSIARNNKFTLDWGWLYYKQQVEVPIGINFKMIRQSMGTYGSAQGIGVDAGAMVRFSLAEFLQTSFLGKLGVGATLTDFLGTKLSWNTQRKQAIPMHLTGGLSYAQPIPIINCIATLNADALIGEREKPRFGMDVTYAGNLSLRVGLNRGLFATGAGFNWENKINVNYSLGMNEALGPEHRLSFAVDIDNLLHTPEAPQ